MSLLNDYLNITFKQEKTNMYNNHNNENGTKSKPAWQVSPQAPPKTYQSSSDSSPIHDNKSDTDSCLPSLAVKEMLLNQVQMDNKP